MTPNPARLRASACAGMFVFGVSVAILGAVLPVEVSRLSFDLVQSGHLFGVLNLGVLVAGLGLGPLMDRYGMKAPMIAGPLLVALSLTGIGQAPSFGALLASVLLLGLGGGTLNAATNTLAADLHAEARNKSAALNLLGVFFGLGALLVPSAMGVLAGRTELSVILAATAMICAAVGVWPAMLAFPPAKHAGHVAFGDAARLLGDPLMLVTAGLLFFQAGNEVLLAGYTTTFLASELGAPVSQASWLLTLLWVTVIAARLGLARVALWIPGHRIVLAGGAISGVGALLLITAQSLAIASAALVICGVGMAGIFPTTMGMAGARHRERSGTVFGILLTISRTGSMMVPYTAGHLAQAAGLRVALGLVLAGALAVTLLESLGERLRWDRPPGLSF